MREFICFILVFYALNGYALHKAGGADNQLKNSLYQKHARHLKSINEIFEIKSNIQLELSPDSALANVTDLVVDTKGNYLICDGTQLNQVWIFSPQGKFLRNLSQQGQGPGEYYAPLSAAVDREGNILINDYLQSKIIYFDKDYKYKNEIKNVRGHFIHVNSRGEIYLYEGMLRPMSKSVFETIKKIGPDGQVIFSFAPLMGEILATRFSFMGDGMDIGDDDNIYEMNPLYYQVRKWSSEGKFIKAFDVPKLLKGIRKSGDDYVILNGPFCLGDDFVIVQRNGLIDLYDREGHYLAGSLALPGKIRYSRSRDMYVELWEQEKTGEQSNPRIICYCLKK
ncbi:MAG: 6-bladed beta-propeller [Candidatus Aminicenantes bacterium]|nr:6-bladed beta-propeller [Candidatus Aminicenantes bacterium]